MRFANLKGFESFVERVGVLFYKEEKQKKDKTKKSREMGINFDEGKAAAGANLYDT